MAMYEVKEPLDGKKFEMLSNNIMVKRFKEKNVTESGIIVSVNEEKIVRRQEGLVLEVGPGENMDDGTVRPMKIRPGDVVWFGEWAGVEFKIGDDQVLFMKDDDVCAIVRERKSDA
jgi:chaperonin GroES